MSTATALPISQPALTDARLVAWRDLVALACVDVLRLYQAAWAQSPLDEAGRAAAAVGVVEPRPDAVVLPLPEHGEFARLVALTGIEVAHEAVLATAWWAAIDPQVAALLGCVHDDAARRYATLGLLALVLAPLGVRIPLLLGENHPLVTTGLMEPVPDPATELRLPTTTVAILAGDRAPAPSREVIAPRLNSLADQAHAIISAGTPVLARCTVAEDRAALRDAVASRAGMPCAPVPRSAAVARLLLHLGHELPTALLIGDSAPPDGTILALGGPTSAAPSGWHTVDVGPPSLETATQVWRTALRRAGLRPAESVVTDLAGRLPLAEHTIAGIVESATSTATALGRRPRLTDVTAAQRAHPRHDPGGLARRMPGAGSLDDLVLPASTRAALEDFMAHARWSPAAHASLGLTGTNGRAVIALFHGPSGTGKTAAAAAVAASLDRDLWIVDLAKVVSKWLGETQQHLDAVLQEAESAGALLLFDEADGLFGKRGEVTDARDRYANLEIDHLLQRIELHQGVVVLTSNRPGALDEAFARRIRLTVRFDLPDHEERERIWARYLPDALLGEGASRAGAAREELSGAAIRAAALAATVRALATGTPVLDEHLAAAVRQQLEKGRRPPTARPGRSMR